MSTPIIRIIAPEETKSGTDKAISKVTIFIGLGSRKGVNVASNNPSI